MAITNLNNDHFPELTRQQAMLLAKQVVDMLASKTRNLTPEERQAYGSINEQNKLVPMKVLEFAHNQPSLRSNDVDYTELEADWNDSMFLRGLIALLMDGVRIADNIRITHDWDCYQASRQDYRHAEYMTGMDNGAQFENKYKTLKEFFTTNPDGNPAKSEEEQ